MTTHIYENLAVLLRTRVPTRQLPCWFSKTVLRTSSIGERPVVYISIVCGLNRKFYKQCNSQRPICDMQFTVVANESNRELRWQGASGWAHPVFLCFIVFCAASGIRHQHGSGSDAAHPGIVPVFCAGMPCKHARMQCHFPAYCPILSA